MYVEGSDKKKFLCGIDKTNLGILVVQNRIGLKKKIEEFCCYSGKICNALHRSY